MSLADDVFFLLFSVAVFYIKSLFETELLCKFFFLKEVQLGCYTFCISFICLTFFLSSTHGLGVKLGY